MKKTLFLMATALAFAGCTSDEFMGDTTAAESAATSDAIVFSGAPGYMQRALKEDGDAAALLAYKFNVYGTKTVESSSVNVFAQTGATTLTNDETYNVWYNTSSANTSLSNKADWEYVANSGPVSYGGGKSLTLGADQTIKYWDAAATKYDFVAYSATKGGTVSDVTMSGFKFTGTADELAGLYIADFLSVPNASYNNATGASNSVKFTFRAACSRVRVGFYEVIPGYNVTAMTFYYTDGNNTEQSSLTDAYLDGKFPGGDSKVVTTVTYDNATKHAVVAQAGTANVGFLNFGTFSVPTAGLAASSANANLTVYKNVVPNVLADNIAPMKLKVDFTLTNTKSGETINVKGATATVPAEYMTWKNNYSYTYLFKISDNTNGSTGGSLTGLYPITFDACVEELTEDGNQGTITTVSEPSITTYQDGSLVTDAVTYKAGTVEIVVTESGAAVDPTGKIKVYTGFTAATEAELALDRALTSANETTVTVSGNKATFTATAGTKYAVVYDNGTTKAYKIIEVAP